MTKLIHGGDIYSIMEKGKSAQEVLDFSANINPLGMPEGVKKAAAEALEMCGNYPDPLCRKLRRAIAKKEQLPPQFFAFGNGAADLIFRLTGALKPKRAMVLAPTFAEYEAALSAAGCRVLHFYLREELGFVLTEDVCQALTEDLDMVFLCNPNNPTGQLIAPDLLNRMIQICEERNILAVVDECFLDFLEKPEQATVKALTGSFQSLFILRAFTKNYAMPGLRLGYGICGNERILSRVSQAGQPWSVSLVAQEAGLRALEEDAYLEEARQLVFREKKVLAQGLSSLGYQVFPPAANYIFFKLKDMGRDGYAESFAKDMEEEGILIRSCKNYKGLGKEYFRIAVRTEVENKRLLEALSRRERLWQKQL